MFVLDDDHLESLRCSKCRKYLSVFPVKNHPKSRDVTCGRCSGDDDSDGGVRSFLYELIAVGYLFRCVNRYEGCRKLLRVDETEEHERQCVGGTFPCPKCEDDVERSALGLTWHYKVEHSSSCLKGNQFNVRPSTDDVMMYVLDDVVFFVSVRHESLSLRLGASTLIDVGATQRFSVSRGGRLWERTERKPCETVGSDDVDLHVLEMDPTASVEVTFEPEVPKGDRPYEVSGATVEPIDEGTGAATAIRCYGTASRSDCKTSGVRMAAGLGRELGYRFNERAMALVSTSGRVIDLTCSNCKLLIGMPAYKCTESKHQMCDDCRGWCGVCDSSVKQLDVGDLLYKIGAHLELPCRWNCGKFFTKDLRTHENSCSSKMFKCSMCSLEMYASNVALIEIHLLDNHEISNFCGDYNGQQIQNSVGQKQNGELSFLIQGKCCHLKWSLNNCTDNYGHHYGYNYGHNYTYDLNFGLYGNKPNVQLAMIYNNKQYFNVLPNVPSGSIVSCTPYINFNSTKQ